MQTVESRMGVVQGQPESFVHTDVTEVINRASSQKAGLIGCG
jgi:hypothetical protein